MPKGGRWSQEGVAEREERLYDPRPELYPGKIGGKGYKIARRESQTEAGCRRVTAPCSVSSRPKTSITAALPPGKREARQPQSRIFSTPGPSARLCHSDTHFLTYLLSPFFPSTLILLFSLPANRSSPPGALAVPYLPTSYCLSRCSTRPYHNFPSRYSTRLLPRPPRRALCSQFVLSSNPLRTPPFRLEHSARERAPGPSHR